MNFEYMNAIMEFLNNELKEEKIPSTTYLSKTYNINIATVNKSINLKMN